MYVPTASRRTADVPVKPVKGASISLPVLITELARGPIFWKNVLLGRDGNENPHVSGRKRRCAFRRCLRRQPRQPVWPIPEAVEVVSGTASNAVTRVCN